MLGSAFLRSGLANNQRLMRCISSLNVLAIRGTHHHLEADNHLRYIGVSRSNKAKSNRNTHLHEKKWRAARGRKNVHIELPNYREDIAMDGMKPEEVRVIFLRRGFNLGKDVGAREWNERQLTMQSFYGVLDAYVPPEKALPILPGISNVKAQVSDKATEVKLRVKNRWNSYMNGTRRIKKKEGFKKFKLENFCTQAEKIYLEAFDALSKRDKDRLLDSITEWAYEKMWPDVEKGNLVWEHLGFKSPTKVVSVRCADYPYKSGNDIAQIIVRMHSVQKYSLFDRFGRLLLGSSMEPKEVVEHIVFENHIAREGSVWRLHDKVYPEWSNKKDAIHRPNLLSQLGDKDRPTKAVPVGEGWSKKTERDAEQFAKKEFEDKGVKSDASQK